MSTELGSLDARRRLEALIDDIVSCADEADGGKVDAETLCRQLVTVAAALPAEPPACAWYQEDEHDECWSTACKNMFSMSSEPPHDWMKFCCYCGGAVTLTPWTPTIDDEDEP